jgi:hypothetical protein
MKRIFRIFITLIVVVLIYAGVNPKKDTSSEAYLKWNDKHQAELNLNHSLQLLILNETFQFSEIELIEITPGQKYFSLWGHVMLRLKGSGGDDPQKDLAVSFLADFNDFPVNDLKASFGGYVVQAKLGTIEQFEKDYVQNEGRKMFYHVIKTDQKRRDLFLKILRDWIREPHLPGGYSFFYNNCVSLLVKLLSEAQIVEPGLYGYWPKYVPYLFKKAGYLK